LGRALYKALGIPQIDLDDLHFLPNWEVKESVEFICDVNSTIDQYDEWIVSGSYQTKMKDSVWPKANIIIWLDLPLLTILGRYFRRTFRRVMFKEKCCGENYETLGHVLFKDNMLLHIFKTYWNRKRRLKFWRNDVFADKDWIVPTDVNEVSQIIHHTHLTGEPCE
jgi:adenylate kinase family enzyme